MSENQSVSRRGLLIGPLAAPIALHAELEDPVLPIYREWCAANAEWSGVVREAGDDYESLPDTSEVEARFYAASDRILACPAPTTLAGIAALAHLLWDYEGPGAPSDGPEYAKQCGQTGNKLIATIWRAASGQDGLPSTSRSEVAACADPIVEAMAEWRAKKAEANDRSTSPDNADAAMKRMSECEKTICFSVAASLAGVRAQFEHMVEDRYFDCMPDQAGGRYANGQDRALVENLRAGLRKHAGGGGMKDAYAPVKESGEGAAS